MFHVAAAAAAAKLLESCLMLRNIICWKHCFCSIVLPLLLHHDWLTLFMGVYFVVLYYNTFLNEYILHIASSVKFSSVAQSCLILCDPMNLSTPGLPVHHQLPESTQTHVHRVGDAIQPSHPLSSLSPPAFSLSQYQWVSCLHQVAKILELQLQHTINHTIDMY